MSQVRFRELHTPACVIARQKRLFWGIFQLLMGIMETGDPKMPVLTAVVYEFCRFLRPSLLSHRVWWQVKLGTSSLFVSVLTLLTYSIVFPTNKEYFTSKSQLVMHGSNFLTWRYQSGKKKKKTGLYLQPLFVFKCFKCCHLFLVIFLPKGVEMLDKYIYINYW